jgi:hypothetical protein
MDAGTAVQTAVYQALTAAPPIGAQVSDGPQQGATYPQIEIQGNLSRAWKSAAVRGEQITVEIHVWSRYDGYKEARALIGSIRDRLDEVDLPMNSGADLVDIQFYNEDLMIDVDNITRHGIVRFIATVVVPLPGASH